VPERPAPNTQGAIMKFYYHPVSTTCRPIMQFAADSGINLEAQVVDLFKGEHLGDAFGAVNPSRQVPVLEDGEFRLKRGRVNELMDWFNTGLSRDLAYGLIYPQVLPHLKRADDKVQAATVAWGRDKTRNWLKILDENVIGPRNAFLCGDAITLADYLGAAYLTLGEVIRIDYSPWPNVSRWLKTMKARPSWAKTNEGFYTYFVAPYAKAPLEAL
jgi:glutathione S-transferase